MQLQGRSYKLWMWSHQDHAGMNYWITVVIAACSPQYPACPCNDSGNWGPPISRLVAHNLIKCILINRDGNGAGRSALIFWIIENRLIIDGEFHPEKL